jgi:hypothetical protein
MMVCVLSSVLLDVTPAITVVVRRRQVATASPVEGVDGDDGTGTAAPGGVPSSVSQLASTVARPAEDDAAAEPMVPPTAVPATA